VGQRTLLSESAFVLEPDDDPLVRVVPPDFLDFLGEVFLKASWAAKSVWR
jgi:hypothetical protein